MSASTETSPNNTLTWHPVSSNCFMDSVTLSVGGRRPVKTIFFAPFSTNHWAVCNPKAPNPPVIR